MQPLEYKHVSADSAGLEVALNEMAKQGWELITIYPSASGATHIAWLKRLIIGDPEATLPE